MAAIEGQPWPKPRSRVVRFAQQLLLGPVGWNAALVDWHSVGVLPREITDLWPRIDGDPGVSPINPRGWQAAAGFAVRQSILDEMQRQNPALAEGAAYLSPAGHVVAGLLPEGRGYGGMAQDGHSYRTLLGRTGREAQIMVPVLIDRSNSTLEMPYRVDETGQIVQGDLLAVGGLALHDLQVQFANAPVV